MTRYRLLLLFIGLLWAAPAATEAARPNHAPSDSLSWQPHIGKQLAVLLAEPWPGAQEKALMLILELERHAGTPIDYTAALPRLFTIYERDPDEGNRLLALAALSAIGTPPVMERLARRIPHERSDRVRRQTLRVLSVRTGETLAGR